MTLNRILVIKLADFGDALLTTPALRSLRAAFPSATIDALTTPNAAIVYRHSGLLDGVETFEKTRYDRPGGLLLRPLAPLVLGWKLWRRHYDAVVLFHHLPTRFGAMKHAALVLATGARLRAGLARPGARRAWFLNRRAADEGYGIRHEVAYALLVAEGLGAGPVDARLSFVPGAAAEVEAAGLWRELEEERGGRVGSLISTDAADATDATSGSTPASPRQWVAIHPGGGPYSLARRWSPERFAGVADALVAEGIEVALVGRSSDGTAAVKAAMRGPVHDLTDLTELPVLAALLPRFDLLLTNDSGVMHLAAAMEVPVVALFGPSNAMAWRPWWPALAGGASLENSPHTVVSLDLPCQPCLYPDHRLGHPEGCATRDCLAWLPEQRVLEAVRATLAGSRTTKRNFIGEK